MHNNIAKGFLRCYLPSISCANSKKATIFTFILNHSVYTICFCHRSKGPVIIYRRGGWGGGAAEDFGLNKVKLSRSPL